MNEPAARSDRHEVGGRGRSRLLLFLGTSAFVLLFVQAARLDADVKLPSLFKDNMVLQRGIQLPVWGTAEPGEAVTVSIGRQTVKAVADADGRWSVKLTPSSRGYRSR